MDEIAKANQELIDILNGDSNANNASEMVQHWLKLTCYNLAYEVAQHKTKKGRAHALEIVKNDSPLFYDDVKQLAQLIFKNS